MVFFYKLVDFPCLSSIPSRGYEPSTFKATLPFDLHFLSFCSDVSISWCFFAQNFFCLKCFLGFPCFCKIFDSPTFFLFPLSQFFLGRKNYFFVAKTDNVCWQRVLSSSRFCIADLILAPTALMKLKYGRRNSLSQKSIWTLFDRFAHFPPCWHSQLPLDALIQLCWQGEGHSALVVARWFVRLPAVWKAPGSIPVGANSQDGLKTGPTKFSMGVKGDGSF